WCGCGPLRTDEPACSCLLVVLTIFFFFFSSRRRHTRFSRDWSSDVCSSDLSPPVILETDEGPGMTGGELPGIDHALNGAGQLEEPDGVGHRGPGLSDLLGDLLL